MYAGVPTVSPVWVSACSLASARATPKSATSVLPSRVEQILGLDVAVEDVVLVRVLEGLCRFAPDPEHVLERELPVPRQSLAQALALDVRHGEPQLSTRFARVEHGEDVRVLQPGGIADFALEAIGTERGGKVGVEYLQGHRSVVPQVVREIDRSHATNAELALERVAVGEGGLEAFQGLGQRDVPERGTSRLNPRALTDQSQPQLLPFSLRVLRTDPDIWAGTRAPMLGHGCPAVPTLGQESPGSSPGGATRRYDTTPVGRAFRFAPAATVSATVSPANPTHAHRWFPTKIAPSSLPSLLISGA